MGEETAYVIQSEEDHFKVLRNLKNSKLIIPSLEPPLMLILEKSQSDIWQVL
jgi:hypothetical protein